MDMLFPSVFSPLFWVSLILLAGSTLMSVWIRKRRTSARSQRPDSPISEKRPRWSVSVDAPLPNTTRTSAEIATYGRFPDYASLCDIPLPSPYTEFDISKALPRPYRPFRWAYHQTMSFKKMEPDWWLELENTYVKRIAERKGYYAQYGKMVLDMLPGMEDACRELMEMALQFLAARYPHYLELRTTSKSPDGKPDVFVNRILNTESNLLETPPLEVLLGHIPEDFALTKRNEETGFYEFRAGVICSSMGWSVATKIGKNLAGVHAPIPDYKEKMEMSMDRYFTKMPASNAIQRGSWGLEFQQPLFMPPGDPHEALRAIQNFNLNLDDIFLRVDWQTLRRLPLSGSIVFNFKGLFTPIAEFRDEPGVPAVVLEVLNKGKKNIMEYKGTWHVEHVVKPALEQWVEEQIQKGLVKRNWEVSTLEAYPQFEGWEEKWHRQQGF